MTQGLHSFADSVLLALPNLPTEQNRVYHRVVSQLPQSSLAVTMYFHIPI